MTQNRNNQKGFTLIELLVVIGIIAVLAGVVIVALNPARQFAQARNSQRQSHVTSILNAIGQRIADNRGLFTCPGGGTIPVAPAAAEFIADDNPAAANETNLAPCLAPTYISSLPFDPSITGAWTGDAHYIDPTDYQTGYTVQQGTDGRITVEATGTELCSAAPCPAPERIRATR